jgi:GNAT superfamily N-acetyltransferase
VNYINARAAKNTTMEDIIIREATTDDIDTLLQFEQGVIAAERPFDETYKEDPINYYNLPNMIEAPHIHLVVAELNGEVIGSGYARIEKALHFLKHAHHAYLGFMYVLPLHRGKGVNKQVIERLGKWAIDNGITELRLEVFDDNKPAIKAYEKAGFSKLLVEMRKAVVV